MNGFPWLTALWLLPLAGAVVAAALPARRRTAARWLALVVGSATLAIAVLLAVRFEPGGERYQFVESHSWIPAFGTRYDLGLDGIALALVLLTAVLVPLLLLAGWRDVDADDTRPRATHLYVALILVVESMVLMSFLALDILLFYVLFEAMLIPMYFLIGGYGQPGPGRSRVRRRGAAALRRGEVPAVQPPRRSDHAGRGDRPVRRDGRGGQPVHVGHLRFPCDRRRGVDR